MFFFVAYGLRIIRKWVIPTSWCCCCHGLPVRLLFAFRYFFVYLYLYNIFIEYTHTYTTIFADNICLAMLLLHSPSVRSTANSHNLLGQPMIALDHVVRLWYSFCDAPHLNAAVLSHFPVVMCQCLVPRQQVG